MKLEGEPEEEGGQRRWSVGGGEELERNEAEEERRARQGEMLELH